MHCKPVTVGWIHRVLRLIVLDDVVVVVVFVVDAVVGWQLLVILMSWWIVDMVRWSHSVGGDRLRSEVCWSLLLSRCCCCWSEVQWCWCCWSH